MSLITWGEVKEGLCCCPYYIPRIVNIVTKLFWVFSLFNLRILESLIHIPNMLVLLGQHVC